MKKESKILTLSFLLSTAASFNLFWVMNILKAANTQFKRFLEVYPPVGPLSGLFLFSILALVVLFLPFTVILQQHQQNLRVKEVVIIYFASAILLFVMTFPLIFGPIARALSTLLNLV